MGGKVRTNHLRAEYLRYVKEHEFLPDHVKDIAKHAVQDCFNLLGQTIGGLELACSRERREGAKS